MKKLIPFCLALFLVLQSNAHPWKPKHYVLVDIDGGLDDFRALNLLFMARDIQVLGISCSDGILPAQETYAKLQQLLTELGHQGVLTGINPNSCKMPFESKFASEFQWGSKSTNETPHASHIDVYNQILKHSKENLAFINLGSLNSLATAVKEIPKLKERIKEAIWTANYERLKGSYNYLIDSISHKELMSAQIPITYIYSPVELKYSFESIQGIQEVGNKYAQSLARSLADRTHGFATTAHDELAVIYLWDTIFYSEEVTNSGAMHYKTNHFYDQVLTEFIENNLANKQQVLQQFPFDTSFYQTDVQAIMSHCLENYGLEEWVAGVISNELHRHLGAYAIIGTKMGLRAKEHFAAGVDEIRILSHTGPKPPLSCMNDGLQVSTGATIGHGLIQLLETGGTSAQADFFYLGQAIRISLKPELFQRLSAELKALRLMHGLGNDLYWDLVRELALHIWKEWDRYEIFNIEPLKKTPKETRQAES